MPTTALAYKNVFLAETGDVKAAYEMCLKVSDDGLTNSFSLIRRNVPTTHRVKIIIQMMMTRKDCLVNPLSLLV